MGGSRVPCPPCPDPGVRGGLGARQPPGVGSGETPRPPGAARALGGASAWPGRVGAPGAAPSPRGAPRPPGPRGVIGARGGACAGRVSVPGAALAWGALSPREGAPSPAVGPARWVPRGGCPVSPSVGAPSPGGRPVSRRAPRPLGGRPVSAVGARSPGGSPVPRGGSRTVGAPSPDSTPSPVGPGRALPAARVPGVSQCPGPPDRVSLLPLQEPSDSPAAAALTAREASPKPTAHRN